MGHLEEIKQMAVDTSSDEIQMINSTSAIYASTL